MIWHPRFDNPTLLGWTVVAAYLLAALSCARVAIRTDKMASDGSKVWWLLAVGLLFLGINKQLNLQTLLIDLGCRAALAGGWYEHRRFVQAVFCAVFALLGFGFMGFFASRCKRFIAKNPLAFAGVVVILSFVVLRALTINHANELFGIELKDENWAWVLELSGSLLVALSAAAAATSTAFPYKGKA